MRDQVSLDVGPIRKCLSTTRDGAFVRFLSSDTNREHKK